MSILKCYVMLYNTALCEFLGHIKSPRFTSNIQLSKNSQTGGMNSALKFQITLSLVIGNCVSSESFPGRNTAYLQMLKHFVVRCFTCHIDAQLRALHTPAPAICCVTQESNFSIIDGLHCLGTESGTYRPSKAWCFPPAGGIDGQMMQNLISLSIV